MFRKAKVVNYVGAGTKWFTMFPGRKSVVDFKPVTDKVLLTWLDTVRLGDERKLMKL